MPQDDILNHLRDKMNRAFERLHAIETTLREANLDPYSSVAQEYKKILAAHKGSDLAKLNAELARLSTQIDQLENRFGETACQQRLDTWEKFRGIQSTRDRLRLARLYEKARLEEARGAFEAARNAFIRRLLKVHGKQIDPQRESAGMLAERAGIPAFYHANMRIIWKNEEAHFYFGGGGKVSHGHYVMDMQSGIRYRRDPGAKRGGHNHTPRRRKRRKQ